MLSSSSLSRRAPRVLAVAAVAVLPFAAACSGSSSGGQPGTTIAVAAGEGTCTATPTSLPAGSVTVTATFTGSGTAEVYLYGKDGDAFSRIVGEVEDLTDGIAKSFTADVTAGAYEVACKAGGKDTRVGVTVS